MSLKHRVIAKFLIDSGRLVKFRQFTKDRREAGTAVSTVLVYEDYGVDEMILCDIATIDPVLVRQVTEEVFTPVTVAGGIHTMAQVDELIRDCGADKVVIKDVALARAVAARYGNQAVVWPIDYSGPCVDDVPSCAGEVLLTNIERDGIGAGLDIEALERDWRVPVVLCGGVGKLSHVKSAFDAGADGVAISSMFIFTDNSPIKLRSYLASNGANVRVA